VNVTYFFDPSSGVRYATPQI